MTTPAPSCEHPARGGMLSREEVESRMRRAGALRPAFAWLRHPALWSYKAKTEDEICCAFVADALASIGAAPAEPQPTSGARLVAVLRERMGLVEEAEPGDVIFFHGESPEEPQHVGLVTGELPSPYAGSSPLLRVIHATTAGIQHAAVTDPTKVHSLWRLKD